MTRPEQDQASQSGRSSPVDLPAEADGKNTDRQITDHVAQPGPMYWDWRCLRCSEPCNRHIGVVRFLARKVLRRG